MKIARIFAAVALLTTVAFSISAQQRPAAPAGAGNVTTQSTVAVPDSKMAVIYTNEFMDQKAGIAKINNLLATLNREFQPRQTELNNLQQRIGTLTKEIEDTQNVANPDSIRQKRDQLTQLNTELKRKGEDAELAYNKRQGELFLPLQEEIGKALEAFAKARGITVIVDGSRVPVAYAATSIDITRAFIADFNSKNPATAVVTQP